MNKLLVIGLDSAGPDLVFERWWDDLPNLRRLAAEGIRGPLRSTIPPITVPAWAAMMTSQDPGQLGFYGFRNRRSYDYEDLALANANSITAKTVWNHLSRHRRECLVFAVPQTYPPKPLRGTLVAGFLTPDKNAVFTHPPEAQAELDAAAGGEYIIDVKDFRTERKDWLLEQIYRMTRARFQAFRYFLSRGDYDFAMLVEMGPDRLQHGFWRYFDRGHRLYEPGNPYESALHDYYVALDEEIGRTLEVMDRADTSVLVVSDHGVKGMVGAIAVNEWLQREGYLCLREPPAAPTRLTADMIDWDHTLAWGEGGYYSRLFLNVQGREPRGQIPPGAYHAVRDEIAAKLEAIVDETGRNIGTRVFKPEECYRAVNNIPPDLIVYFGNLDWRAAGSVGVGSVYLYENDTGPDDANHAEDGLLLWRLPARRRRALPARGRYSIYDVAPSILTFFGIAPPAEMIGQSLFRGDE